VVKPFGSQELLARAEALLRGGSHSTDQVKLYVSYLRRKLRGATGVEPISTLRGSGYRYESN